MLRIMRTKILFIAIGAAAVPASVPFAAARPASDSAPVQIVAAPVPIQILTGKKVFISNGVSTAAADVPNLPYNEFYANMKAWGRYELAATPADADLVFELRYVSDPPSPYLELRLAIRDPKTRTVLWSFVDSVDPATREVTRRKNFELAMTKFVQDVKTLAGSPVAPSPDK
jgi:hypothetical protein